MKLTRLLAVVATAWLLACGGASAQLQGNVSTQDTRLLDANCNQTSQGIFYPACYVPAGGGLNTAISGSGNTAIYPFDAAWNAAYAWVTAGNQGAVIYLPNTALSGCNAGQGYVQPTAQTSPSGGISVIGTGEQTSAISLYCTISRSAVPAGNYQAVGTGYTVSNAMVWMPMYQTAVATNWVWRGFTWYANGKASLVADLEGLMVGSTIEDIVFSGANGSQTFLTGDGNSQTAEVRVGNSTNSGTYTNRSWGFQNTWRHVDFVSGGQGGHGATFTAPVTLNSGVPSVAITAAGTGYSANTIVYLTGCPSSGATSATRLTVTLSGSGLASVVDPGSTTFYNCNFYNLGPAYGATYAHAFDPVYPITVGLDLDNSSDSTFTDLNPTTGTLATMLVETQSGSNTFIHAHPCCFGIPVGIIDEASNNTYIGTEQDSPGLWGFEFYGNANPTLVGTQWLWNTTGPYGTINYQGAQAYLLGTATTVAPKIFGDTCVTGLYANQGSYYQINYNFGASGNNTPQNANMMLQAPSCDGTTTYNNILPGPLATGAISSSAGVSGTTGTFTGALSGATLKTAANCASAASPAVCAAAASGSVVIAAGATTVVVNDTAVTANSIIQITDDYSQGTKLGVTCNTTLPSELAVTAKTVGTSFTILSGSMPATNPLCLDFAIIN